MASLKSIPDSSSSFDGYSKELSKTLPVSKKIALDYSTNAKPTNYDHSKIKSKDLNDISLNAINLSPVKIKY